MDTPLFLSVLALGISIISAVAAIASALAAKQSVALQKKEHEQKSVVLSVEADPSADTIAHWALRISNTGHSSAYLWSVKATRIQLSWTHPFMGIEIEPGASYVVNVLKDDFTIKPGVEVTVSWTLRKNAIRSEMNESKRVL